MRILIAMLVVALGFSAAAQAETAGGLIGVEHVWARATPKGAPNAVVYLTIINRGEVSDSLIGVSSPAADNVQIHQASNENGVSKMRALDALDVLPGTSVKLQPSGIHLMLLQVKQQLKEGETFPLTLNFEKAGAIEVTVKVGKVGAMDDMSGM